MMIFLLLLQAKLTLSPAEVDRRWILAEWEGDGKDIQLKDADGAVVPCQRQGKTLTWLVRELPAGKSAIYSVEPAAPAAAMKLEKNDGGWISVSSPDREITRLYTAAAWAKPFLYPLTADGVNVLRSHPIEAREGEAKDHPHHTGIFHSHGDVNKLDHWGSKDRIEGREVTRCPAGPVFARLIIASTWGKDLEEEQEIRVLNAGSDSVIDLEITLTAKGPVTLGKTKEGTFAVRVATGLTRKDDGADLMLDAKGNKGEKAIRADRAPWVDHSGEVDGKKVGVALMNHPTSFRSPPTWHVRAYGLLSANPYINAEHAMKAGESISLRYRIYAHAGDAATAKVAAVYAGYTIPVRVE